MKEISLTQDKVALVDDEDFEYLNQVKWYALKNCNTFYARRKLPQTNGKERFIFMHHAVLGKPPKGLEVDHKNGNGLDNQRHNLRFVTRRQNCQNKKNISKSSQHSGICWDRQRQKWLARIRINGKEKHLGRFINELEAFKAYKKAVNDLGEIML